MSERFAIETLESRTLLSALQYTDTWVGNSYGKGDGLWVQNNINGLYVAPDGTAYTNSWWDEGRRESGFYRGSDGLPIGALESLHDSFGGGFAVAGDPNYVYVSNWDSVRRTTLTGPRAPFSGGVGPFGDSIDVSTNPTGTNKAIGVQGLAVDKVNGRLFVAENTDNEVEVWNTSTMTFVRKWTVARPGEIAVAPDGTVWIVSRKDATNPGRILHYNVNGSLLSQVITGAAGFDPSAVSWDAAGNRLLVGDNGPDQNVKIYSNLSTSVSSPSATFGNSIFSGTPGQVTNTKFGTASITGVGTDSVGNIYVSMNGVGKQAFWNGGGAVLESWTASGTLRWRKVSLDFVDSADADMASDNGTTIDVYDKYSRYQMDLSRTTAGTEWSYKGRTLNQVKYPADQRFVRANDTFDYTGGTLVRNVGGRKLMYVMDMQARRLLIYRFNATTDGEVAIPAGIFETQYGYSAGYTGSPGSNDFIWRDKNGNGAFDTGEYAAGPGMPNLGYGMWVDTNGDLWSSNHYAGSGVGIRQWKMQGFDANGNPIYDYSAGNYVQWQRPAGSNGDIRRIEYYPATDTMYVSSISTPNGDRDIGTRIVKYNNWSTGSRSIAWTLDPALDNTRISAMTVAGDYLFLGYSYFGTNSKEGTIQVYKVSDGTYVGKIAPTPVVGSESGTFDIPYAIRAVKRANGEYLIFAEDDHYAKVIVHRWNPTSGTNLVDDLDDLSRIDAGRSTANWGLDGANQNLMDFDASRASRTTDTIQRLVWNNPAGAVDFTTTLYFGSALNIDALASFATSADGTNWVTTTTARTPTIDSSNNGGWSTTTFRPAGALPTGTKFLRLSIAPSGIFWNVQVGRVEVFGPTVAATSTRTDNLSDLSQTDAARTTGTWTIDSSNPSYFQNDTGRAIRTTDATAALAWNDAGLQTFAATVGYDQALNIDAVVTFTRSSDGVSWSPVTVSRTAPQQGGGGGWVMATFSPSVALPAGTNYVRLQIAPVGTNWKVQVSRMVLTRSAAQTTLVDGLADLSKTNAARNSSGWAIDGSNASFFNGDVNRATRSTDTTQWLVWNYAAISTFSTKVYYDQALNINSLVTFYASTNGTTWTPITVQRTTTTGSGGGGWGLTTFTPVGPLATGTNFIKMQIAPTGTNWNVQIGEMAITYG